MEILDNTLGTEMELVRRMPPEMQMVPKYIGGIKDYLEEELKEHLNNLSLQYGQEYGTKDVSYAANNAGGTRTIKIKFKLTA